MMGDFLCSKNLPVKVKLSHQENNFFISFVNLWKTRSLLSKAWGQKKKGEKDKLTVTCGRWSTLSLRQDPLEAILVIFGCRALIFFVFESSWKKMKNDATFVRMRTGDHLGDAKMSK